MPIKVAYLGPEATFTHEAAVKKFGPAALYLPQATITDTFVKVASGEIDYGVAPVENSLEGAVTNTLDMFGRADLEDIKICDEIHLPITQNLLTHPEGPLALEDIRVVYSHWQALAQCRQWLQDNLPRAELQETKSTAAAAQIAAENKECAAISNRLAAEKYGLKIFQAGIQDADFNQTRFLVISRQLTPHSSDGAGRPVTAIMLSIKDRVGALHAVTSVLLKYGLNLNRIESRPSKQKAWDYVFFIDFFGQPSQPSVASALKELASETVWVRVLGAWTREAGALKQEE